MAFDVWGWFGYRSSGVGQEFQPAATPTNWGWFGNRSSGEGLEFSTPAAAWSDHAWLRGGQYIMAAQAGVPNVNGSADAHIGFGGSGAGARAAIGGSVAHIGTSSAEVARKGAYSAAAATLGTSSTGTSRKGAVVVAAATLGTGGVAVAYKSGLVVVVATLGVTSTSSGTQQGGAPAVSGGAVGAVGLYAESVGSAEILTVPAIPGISGFISGVIIKKKPKLDVIGSSAGCVGIAGQAGGVKVLTHRPTAKRRAEELFLIAA